MEPVTLAWAAGIIEGEGCFDYVTKKSTGYTTIRLRVTMTDRDVVEKLQGIMGVGIISARTQGSYKETYTWAVYGTNAHKIILLLLPHLGVRRKTKALELIKIYEDSPRRDPQYRKDLSKKMSDARYARSR